MRFLARQEVRTDETDRHSVSCIVMQRAENVPDAFSRFTLGENIPFYGFCVRKRLRAFQRCVQLRDYGK